MINLETKLFIRHELDKHYEFFIFLRDVLSGVITRKHMLLFYPNHEESFISRWVKLGMIEAKHIEKCHYYQLKYISELGITNRPKATTTLLMRSYLRLEYLLSLGLKTPTEMLDYTQAGNDKTSRKKAALPLLERYQEALITRGIEVPELDCPTNARMMERLETKNVFLSKIQYKDGCVIPILNCYVPRSHNIAQTADNLLEAYREWTALFYGESAPAVKPLLQVLTFDNIEIKKQLYRRLKLEPEFLVFSDENLEQIFPVLSFPSLLRFLSPDNLV